MKLVIPKREFKEGDKIVCLSCNDIQSVVIRSGLMCCDRCGAYVYDDKFKAILTIGEIELLGWIKEPMTFELIFDVSKELGFVHLNLPAESKGKKFKAVFTEVLE